ncbi:MAG: nucleotidyltransferase domain-containing protein [bacterium]|nr:nucleotidyltransferase domain-containing protein [bacterium]
MSGHAILHTLQAEQRHLPQQALEVICSVARQQGLEIVQIYLFGSRARSGGEKGNLNFYVPTGEPVSRAQTDLIPAGSQEGSGKDTFPKRYSSSLGEAQQCVQTAEQVRAFVRAKLAQSALVE